MSYSKLRGRIREVFGTQEDFATAMGMDRSTLSQKLNGKSGWTRLEMEKACDVLHVDIAEVHLYFFATKVWNSKH